VDKTFVARYAISYVQSLPNNVFQLDGNVFDDSMAGYSALDATIGDLVFDESVWFGDTHRWKITAIILAETRHLICQVVYDDTPPDPDKPEPEPQLCQGVICRPTPRYRLSTPPTLTYTKISEALQTRIRGIDNLYIIDNIQGGGPTPGPGQYIHRQTLPTTEWHVHHNLNQQHVSVTVIDESNSRILELDTLFTGTNNLTIRFTEAVSGWASVIGGSSGTWGQSEVAEKTEHYELSPEDFEKTIICDTDDTIIFTLPIVDSAHIGKWLTISKLGTGPVEIRSIGASRVDSASAGGSIFCNETTVSTVQLQYVKENRWISIGKTGIWNFS
jgi:hypothetical protein